ncbi:MAG TPA: class I SAM-dependent methyltransferase [Puia sp.]|uniref:class I SAM-dependent methyltransferase n=1 Tax=Puia sp. TaxID=2045100 RepID=UPI002C9D0DA2|nr:class I SAM-dependent methyltransferase [Puia sp.]HVU95396.1 class I SAM-dependent methyltransferase [Puia sp.]
MTHREATTFLDTPALRTLMTGTPTHWADLGCGSGTFTLALAELLAPHSTLAAIDLQPGIKQQTTKNNITIRPQAADITQPNPTLQNLDGILIANAIHYVRDQPAFIKMLHTALQPGAVLILIEYDTDTPVPRWVPYPLSYTSASRLLSPPDWTPLQKGNTRPSAYGRANLYCAFTTKK